MFFRWRNYLHFFGMVFGFAAFASLLLPDSGLGRGRSLSLHLLPSTAEIRWDEFGIPHIYGRDLLTVVRGLGYAEMENHAETILMNVAAARSRSAEYFGPGECNGQGVCANIQNDILVRTEDIPNRAQAWLKTGGDEQAQIIQAFTDGANKYALLNGFTIDPLFRQVLPVVPTDITAIIQYAVHFRFMPSQNLIPDLLSAWQSGGTSAANALACAHVPGCVPGTQSGTTLARNRVPAGSNGWAVAPQKSASGNAILMGNPHLPWGNNSPLPGLGIFQWMEVNLVIGDTADPELNASGAVLVGAPFIGIGYSDEVGWTHTNSTIQNTNLYELTLNSDGTYNFGERTLPLQHRTDIIKIRRPGGSLVSQSIDIFASVHGPVVMRNGNKALALRVAGLNHPSVVSQYWGMIRAHNLEEFKTASSALQMPFFNLIYADCDGHILYWFGGQQPRRPGGDWGKYAGVLDGSDPALLWSDTDTFTWLELPHAIDPKGGFVANGNDPPWTATFPQTPTNDPAKFPAYVAPQFMDLRAQSGANFLVSAQNLTPAQVLNGKESTHMLLADRVLADLIAAATQYGDTSARQAAKILAAWDRSADAGSRGAVLFETWWTIVMTDPSLAKDNTINFYSAHPAFKAGWSAKDPLNTPSGLANATAMVADLSLAAQLVRNTSCAEPPCPLDVAWGDVHKIVLVAHDRTFQKTIFLSNDPQSGADELFGMPRVVSRIPAPDGIHFWAYGGDGYVQLVEFAKGGAKARALLTYGNASRPSQSGLQLHVTDQLPFFNAKSLRPVYRARDEVNKHTVALELVL